jgi:hypothetical protein
MAIYHRTAFLPGNAAEGTASEGMDMDEVISLLIKEGLEAVHVAGTGGGQEVALWRQLDRSMEWALPVA